MCRKGFEQDDRDHKYLRFFYNGMKTSVKTKVSHGEKEIGDILINEMAKQIKLVKKEFIRFVSCDMNKDEYTNYLLSNNHIW